MAVLKIAPIGEPILRRPARRVEREELVSADTQRFIDDLIETMRDAKGAGLAATQVYDERRICVMEVGKNPRYPYKPPIPLTVLVNPTVTAITEERFQNFEGCLSVPNLRGKVQRYCEIDVSALDRHGNPINERARGMTAATYQHEVDHLLGILFLDRVEDSHSLVTWDNFERYHREQVADNVQQLVSRYGS